MPNPMTPNLGPALPNLGFGGMSRPEPKFFEQGGGFQSFGQNLRQMTRPLAAGFAKDPNYRAQAAQQLASEEQMQQEQAAQVRRAVLEASLDSLGQLAESMKGVGSEKITGSPSTMQMIERSANNAMRAMVASGFPEADAAELAEQYKWRILQAADIPGEEPDPFTLSPGQTRFSGAGEEIASLPEEAKEDTGRKVTVALGKGQTQQVTIFKNGTTDLIVGGRQVMANEIMGNAGDYRSQLAQDESAGGQKTVNPLNPNVSGKYQVSGPHWPQLEGLDDESKLTVILNTNAQEFKGAFGKDPTDADQYGMHRLGAGGYQQLLSAPAGSDVVDVVGDVVVEDNPDLAGKTVGDLLTEWKSRYGGGTTWRNKSGQTDDVLSELREEEKPPAQSAAEAEIERFQQVLGLSPDEAVRLQSGTYRLTAPDAEGNVSVIDLSTMTTVKTVNPTAELAAAQGPKESIIPADQQTPFTKSLEDEVLKGTGGLAALQRFFGSTAGQVLAGEEFPQTQEATRNIRAFNNAARKLIAQGITTGSDRLSNQEQFWSMELLPEPDAWFADPESEAKKIPVLRKNMGAQMQVIDDALKNPKMTRDQRANLTDYRNGLSLLINMMGPEPRDTSALEAERDALLAKPGDEWTAKDYKRAEELLKELGGGENP